MAFVASLAFVAFCQDTGPYPGNIAPSFILPTLDGKTVDLAALYKDSPVWLTLFTTWCPECNIETPILVNASQKYPNVRFVAVSLMEEVADVRDFQKRFEVPYPMVLDEEGLVVEKYAIRPIPVNIGIKKGGQIAFRRQSISSDRELESLMPSLIQGDQPEPVFNADIKGALGMLFKTLPVLASFIAGLLTFLSPCILPLIPAYIALVTGFELNNLIGSKNLKSARRSVLVSTGIFVLGFGSVFTLLGATASVFGSAFAWLQSWIRIIGGAVLIAFGLHLTGALTIMPLYREIHLNFKPKKADWLGAFLFGVVFAVGWTPCVGPILSAILVYSASEATLGQGLLLLSSYSAGIGVPFLLASAFLPQFQGFLNRVKPHFQAIEIGSGALLILLGFLLITNKFGWLAALWPGF